ncbi:hypothetical protein M0R04_10330 [Candidatus Dojkabacteria bacterium]|jgi:hypothetical protein|nr:hypothetical protein [Candidatus Dojkabacteria bacterium]
MNQNSWESKIEKARKVEQEILLWWRKHYDEKAELTEGYNSDYDIVSSRGNVEIKEDRMAHQTNNYALEFETHDGKPSGFIGTKAEYFCIVDWEYVSIMATSVLKDIVNDMEVKKTIDMGQMFPDGKRNKGYLIPRERILRNGSSTVIERWFPYYE